MSTGCKKGIPVGLYQWICGNKYNGKLFICEDCKTPEIVFDKDDLEEMDSAFYELFDNGYLKEKGQKAWDKVKLLLKDM